MKKAHWTDINRNKYMFGIHQEMLTNEGKTIITTFPLIGEPKKSKELKEVVFDKTYVQEWIIQKLFIPLIGMSKQEIFELLERIYDSTFIPTQTGIDEDTYESFPVDETL